MPYFTRSDSGGAHVFQATSLIPVDLETIIHFHAQPNALILLTPPPLIVQIRRDERRSLTAGEVDFVLWFGPFPVRWLARHEAAPTVDGFIDRMIVGPMARWEHQHRFKAVAGSVQLVDQVTFTHKPGWRGWLTRLLFDGIALRVLFWYRHWRTERECRQIESARTQSAS